MKRALALVLCFVSVGLANQRPNRISFDPVQPPGQRSRYKLQYESHCKNLDAEGVATDDPVFLTAELETIASSGGSDGPWTLGCTFKSLTMRERDRCISLRDATKSAGFSLNLDHHGKVVGVLASDPEDRTGEDGDLLVIHNVLFYLLPTMLLPNQPVATDGHWVIDETISARFGTDEWTLDRIRGKGRLKQLAGDLAFIETDFNRELSFSDSPQEPDLLEQGSGNMLLTYDLRQARFVEIQLHSAMKTARFVYSDSENHVQTTIDSILTVQLLNQ